MTILNAFPVLIDSIKIFRFKFFLNFKSYIREPKKLLMAMGLGLAGAFLKWNNFVNIGGVETTQQAEPSSTQTPAQSVITN